MGKKGEVGVKTVWRREGGEREREREREREEESGIEQLERYVVTCEWEGELFFTTNW